MSSQYCTSSILLQSYVNISFLKFVLMLTSFIVSLSIFLFNKLTRGVISELIKKVLIYQIQENQVSFNTISAISKIIELSVFGFRKFMSNLFLAIEIFKSSSFVREQINKTEQLIKSLGQTEVTYFRPPYTSKYIILPLVLNSLNKELVTGTYDPPSQYISPYNAINVANEVIVNTEKGSIVYLHDGKEDDQQQFIESVELIILGLKENGYKFVRVDYKN